MTGRRNCSLKRVLRKFRGPVLTMFLFLPFLPSAAETQMYITPNEFAGSDIERINQAIEHARGTGVKVVVPKENRTNSGASDIWLIDSAILLYSDTVLELNNCRIKLSDRSRDNIIRSANCGMGVRDIEPVRNVHIYGVGSAVLEGADRPRSTGDGGKRLGEHTYGTDAGVENESQTGDWRNIGILLAHVENFRIENLKIKDSHAWAISLERCKSGHVGNIEFDSLDGKEIDGSFRTFLNQDGLNIRAGSQNITIENLSGRAGDDLLALTNISREEGWTEPGSLNTTQVSGNRHTGAQDDIRNIYISNIRGYSSGGHNLIRLLNTRQGKLYNVFINGVNDTSPEGRPGHATVLIGSTRYGGPAPLGYTRNLFISNVRGASKSTVRIDGPLADSFITNIIHGMDEGGAVKYTTAPEQARNVLTSNLIPEDTVEWLGALSPHDLTETALYHDSWFVRRSALGLLEDRELLFRAAVEGKHADIALKALGKMGEADQVLLHKIAVNALSPAVRRGALAGLVDSGMRADAGVRAGAEYFPPVDFDVVIDGGLSEWEGSPPLFSSEGKPGVEVRGGWDKSFFYLAVSVKDEKHFNTGEGGGIWDGDSLQFAVDPLKEGIPPFSLGLALASGRVQAHKWRGEETGLLEDSEYAVVRDERLNKTSYEIKLPLEHLFLEPAEGAVFGFNTVVFNDDYGEGYQNWIQMSPGLAGGWDPSEFILFMLKDKR